MYSEPCVVCGEQAQPIRERIRVQIGTRATTVMADRMKCTVCEEAYYLPGQMQDAQRRAADKLRADEGLLSGEQVRAIRAGLGLSQPEFERLLGVGPKTVIRWERGTIFQNAATDTLMRILRDVPGAVEYLASERGISLGIGSTVDIPGVGVSYTVLVPPSDPFVAQVPVTIAASSAAVIDMIEYRRFKKQCNVATSMHGSAPPSEEVGT